MSLFALAEGLFIGYECFIMKRMETKVQHLEEAIDTMSVTLTDIDLRLKATRKVIQQLSNHKALSLRDQALQLLGQHKAANMKNADVVATLVASLGGPINAITFKGRKKRGIADGILDHRGFIAGTQAVERIFYGLGKMGELSSLTGGRIVTACVSSKQDMIAAGLAIAAFYKVAEIFGLSCCPISDENRQDRAIVVRFEGRYDLHNYVVLSSQRDQRTEIVHGARKNVYILGTNGVGKSSWGNLITGEETFEVGMSDHTTMIPQSCDVDREIGFRLWDTPGLFDGSEQAGLMEEHMNSVIEANGYCSAVIFVFSGAVPANQITADTLQYAKDKFGESICQSFVAIINDIAGLGEGRKGAYIQMLHEFGFDVTGQNIFVASAIDDRENIRTVVKLKLGSFKYRLVRKHQLKYERIINREGGLANAVMAAHTASKDELEALLRRGKIETLRYRNEGPRKNTSIPKDVIIFRQHSKGYFIRKLGFGHDKVLEERSVLLKGPSRFKMQIRAHLNMEYQIGQVGVFLAHVLCNPRHILIHTPRAKNDYELRDISEMTDEQFREYIIETMWYEQEVTPWST